MLARISAVVLAGFALWAGPKLIATRKDLKTAAGAFLACEAAAACWAVRRLRGSARPVADALPPAIVLIPVMGRSARLEANARAHLSQRYPGSLRVVFVVPSREDPARPLLEELGAEVWASEAPADRGAGKLIDLAFALERVPEDRELVLCSEGDVRVTPDFAARLAQALAEPRVALAVGGGVPVPAETGVSGALALAWYAGAFPAAVLRPVPWAGAMMFRRRDMAELAVPAGIRRAISDDGFLARALAGRGETRLVAEAVVRVESLPGLRAVMEQHHRWLVSGRVYTPRLWTLGALAVLGKCALVLSLAWPRPMPDMLAAFAAVEAGIIALVGAALCARVGASPARAFASAPAGPILFGLYALQTLRSAFTDEVVWGSRRYRVSGPEHVERIA